jgi:ligand-binding sensor domain-containing protein/anti-sigma regulatory factor (Ser/Thr protein kinase)
LHLHSEINRKTKFSTKSGFIHLTTVISFLLVLSRCFAQHPPYLHFDSNNGLAAQNVYSCGQDTSGFMWFASENGALRFDGKTFKRFTVEDGLPDNAVLGVRLDETGKLIFVTFTKSMAYFNPASQRFISDAEDTTLRQRNDFKPYKNRIDFSLPEQNGCFKKPILLQKQMDHYSEIIFRDGIYKVKDCLVLDSISFSSIIGIPEVQSAFRDLNGHTWLCTTDKGVYCILNSSVQVIDENSGLPFGNPQFTLIRGDTLIIGSSYNEISVRFGKEWKNYALSKILSDKNHNKVRKMEFRNDHLFVLHDQGLNVYSWPDMTLIQTDHRYNKSFSFSNDNEIMYSGSSSAFLVHHTYAMDTIFCKNIRVTSVLEDGRNGAWFGSIDGLYYYSSKTGEVESLKSLNVKLGSLIVDIKRDQDGVIWVATSSFGLIALHNKRVRMITKQDGLISNTLRNIFISDEKICIATNDGFTVFNSQMAGDSLVFSNFHSYQQSQGLPNNDVNALEFVNGKFYVSTSKGLCILEERFEQAAAPIIINNIYIENQKVATSAAYQLNWDQDDLRIDFSAICLTCGTDHTIQYAFIKSEEDTTWISTTERSINFVSLQSGTYNFLIKSGDEIKVNIRFTIAAIFYKKIWFWALISLMIIATITVSQYFRHKQIRSREKERADIDKQFAQLETQALRLQMNPHFFYNTMSSLQHVIRTAPKEEAEEYVQKISKLMRLVLETSRNEFVTLEMELSFLTSYIELEQIRFEHSFQYEINNEVTQLLESEIPSMIVQPFIENAINHGLRYKKNGDGLLKIHIRQDDIFVVFVITDNGIGRNAAEIKKRDTNQLTHKSRGIEITMDRLRLINDKHFLSSSVEIEDVDEGTVVTIKLELSA